MIVLLLCVVNCQHVVPLHDVFVYLYNIMDVVDIIGVAIGSYIQQTVVHLYTRTENIKWISLVFVSCEYDFHLAAQVSPWHRRTIALSHSSSSPRISATAFVLPPAPRTDHPRSPHRFRHGRRCSSRMLSVSSAAAVLSRKRPLKMSAAAAAATAAAAVAAALTRCTLPGNGALRVHRPRSAQGLVALSGSRSDDAANKRGGEGDSLGMRRALLSMMRWILTGGILGMKRPTVRKTGLGRGVGGVSGGLQGLLVRMWPFAAAGGAAEAAGDTSLSSKGGSSEGEGGGPMRRHGGRSSVRPTAIQQVQYKYPRPQSTAYPRPQSTAYPRPKVTVPTLLNLEEVEEAAEVRPGKQQLAASSWPSSPSSTLSSSSSISSAAANAKHKEGDDGNPLLSKFLCWFFARVITNRAKLVEGLEVKVDARSNRDAMSGLLQAVGITFNHLVLENVEISGGATMRITGLDLKVMTLLWRRFRSFKRPFEVRVFAFFLGVIFFLCVCVYFKGCSEVVPWIAHLQSQSCGVCFILRHR